MGTGLDPLKTRSLCFFSLEAYPTSAFNPDAIMKSSDREKPLSPAAFISYLVLLALYFG
jgi:hypothetical protein